MRTISEAAIIFEDKIYTGRMHSDILACIRSENNIDTEERKISVVKAKQGFIDNCGVFVNRREAREIAYNAGQITYLDRCPSELYSEFYTPR